MNKESENIVELLTNIDTKLNVIISELIRQNVENISVKDLIEKLYSRGIDSNNIASILGISVGHASKEISILKKSKEKGNGKRKSRSK